MDLSQRKKLKGQLKNIIKTNHLFNEYIESLIKKYPLHTDDEKNALQLQEHLNNMTVIFTGMQTNVEKKK